jgi:hypothetical protein
MEKELRVRCTRFQAPLSLEEASSFSTTEKEDQTPQFLLYHATLSLNRLGKVCLLQHDEVYIHVRQL